MIRARLILSVLALLCVSSFSGCVSDARPQIKTALDIAGDVQKSLCKSAAVESPEWAQCKSLDAAARAARVAVDLGDEDSVMSSSAEVLEGLKAVWHVKCDETPTSGFCSASKTVVNALISVYTSVNEQAQ